MADLPIRVAALYRFAPMEDLGALRTRLLELCQAQAIKGTLLIAPEGINGTIAGEDAAIESVVTALRALPGCGDLDVKYSRAPALPFRRMKVRIKREIVTMGQPDIDPLAPGHYLDPAEWNALIADPETVVIDTRNAYEVAIGTFAGAVDPGTRSFREFPGWFRQHRDELLGQGKRKVAMFCTGGIRCEKSTAFLKAEGIEAVYHLKGGILKYLEEMPEPQSLWQGECYVFDERVSVGHGLVPGDYASCKACGRPVSREEQVMEQFIQGERCARCPAPSAGPLAS
ncbi:MULTISPECIES: rhodanese-related sulfurtransferase [unclassified Novosphingobium]|uniref:oxygen-dependent tRNA uridine(34) hydroxylase TrhO n=1 Tax=Novosphingobium sp. TaxID=1874826 RepID=UPI0025E07002|nr:MULTISPECIES: rhodanese-related sulfurtransferase [unclassified Novosphingobium]HQV04828.1 rhodanese-related sulfurtransferase [Novosphingobium sp.]